LYSSAAPLKDKPETYTEYAGPPEFLCSNFGMWLLSPFFKPIMGMEPEVIHTMLPVSERREGMILDAKQANPDMARNFDDYSIESLQAPTLIFHAKDDKMADYALMEQAAPRFPNHTFITFETGGHLMQGHGGEIDKALDEFIAETSGR
jgi:pimeloyl-ACP methyl ester carboxylesterase